MDDAETRRYPERKSRDLDEKVQLRARIEAGEGDSYRLAAEFGCSPSQVAGIKAAMHRRGDDWDPDLREAVRAVLPAMEGKPCVNVSPYEGGVYVCRRMGDLVIEQDCLGGTCDWVDPPEERPDSLS